MLIHYINKTTIVLFVSVFAYACSQHFEKVKSENDIVKLLCHSWSINSTPGKGIEEIYPAESFSVIQFMSGGNLVLYTIDTMRGNWKYEKGSKKLVLKIKDKNDAFNIISISESKLILENENRKLDLFRKEE